jgi:hypothetical protein
MFAALQWPKLSTNILITSLLPKFLCCSQNFCVLFKIFVLFSKFLCCSHNFSVVLWIGLFCVVLCIVCV